jgi:hypothetical protein
VKEPREFEFPILITLARGIEFIYSITSNRLPLTLNRTVEHFIYSIIANEIKSLPNGLYMFGIYFEGGDRIRVQQKLSVLVGT